MRTILFTILVLALTLAAFVAGFVARGSALSREAEQLVFNTKLDALIFPDAPVVKPTVTVTAKEETQEEFNKRLDALIGFKSMDSVELK